jgi:hypothetical protein
MNVQQTGLKRKESKNYVLQLWYDILEKLINLSKEEMTQADDQVITYCT